MNVYHDFGFNDVDIKIALRPAQRLGDDASWDLAEDALRNALKACGADLDRVAGRRRVLRPEDRVSPQGLDRPLLAVRDHAGRFPDARRGSAPEFVDVDNARKVPVMLHRAIVGSLERFIGILIEHYAGALPVWLSPVQVVVLTITDRQAEYAQGVTARLKEAGIRAFADLRNEKITYKIREHSLQKLPYQVIVGDKELQAGQVAVRTRTGEDLGAMPLASFIERLQSETASRR